MTELTAIAVALSPIASDLVSSLLAARAPIPTACASAGGYQNPFAHALTVQASRIDMGVDYAGTGVIDAIAPEPPGGAQNDPDEAARLLRQALVENLDELAEIPPDELRRRRREKFRSMGVFA